MLKRVLLAGGGVIQGNAEQALTTLTRRSVFRSRIRSWASAATRRPILSSLACSVARDLSGQHGDATLTSWSRSVRASMTASRILPSSRRVQGCSHRSGFDFQIIIELIVGAAELRAGDSNALVRERRSGRTPSTAIARTWMAHREWRDAHGLDHDQRHRVEPGGLILPQVVVQSLYNATR